MTYIERAADGGDDSGCEIRAGDDRHLFVPIFNSLSHFLFYFFDDMIYLICLLSREEEGLLIVEIDRELPNLLVLG